ncbi:hypothetical protein METBIDRAFT_217904 [Metschnikowia bicuspidata var. bicuspidata NRRL YB-4993]|uniref:Uncharacterized protein n=1 Tax=Metschnikowia bicuspidata var. bicuspidata NRRL YB-4993 TaxID=869754 RepID=A0A1A0H6I6_9ASCO|nr:hypothetical protein METBIDRAFT_217904 [Metschnikowia bicuspidata var. bicuspidata NRRL YB-4993]OBA19646.1 hypothetical protein METBIDRAFT_217904 [Metschnikowia bicuspidata var. bicuspidata NRRL YB-4993]
MALGKLLGSTCVLHPAGCHLAETCFVIPCLAMYGWGHLAPRARPLRKRCMGPMGGHDRSSRGAVRDAGAAPSPSQPRGGSDVMVSFRGVGSAGPWNLKPRAVFSSSSSRSCGNEKGCRETSQGAGQTAGGLGPRPVTLPFRSTIAFSRAWSSSNWQVEFPSGRCTLCFLCILAQKSVSPSKNAGTVPNL